MVEILQQGASIVIPAKTSAKFTFSVELVNKINKK